MTNLDIEDISEKKQKLIKYKKVYTDNKEKNEIRLYDKAKAYLGPNRFFNPDIIQKDILWGLSPYDFKTIKLHGYTQGHLTWVDNKKPKLGDRVFVRSLWSGKWRLFICMTVKQAKSVNVHLMKNKNMEGKTTYRKYNDFVLQSLDNKYCPFTGGSYFDIVEFNDFKIKMVANNIEILPEVEPRCSTCGFTRKYEKYSFASTYHYDRNNNIIRSICSECSDNLFDNINIVIKKGIIINVNR